MTNSDLPIERAIGDIVAALKTQKTVVVHAPPGTGKSTRVPLALRDSLKLPLDIRVAQPRRLAARNLATYVAKLDGGTIGGKVGYEVRFDRKISRETGIRYVTDGLLLRQLISDPFLEKTSLVILDEFHERSVQTDLVAAFLRDLQTVRDDLYVVVMSATLESDNVAEFFDATVVAVDAPIFPLELIHRETPVDYRDLQTGLIQALQAALKRDGDILVFLPGARDIQHAAEMCRSRFPDLDVRTLYGSMDGPKQTAALAGSDQRRVIFSTNIAETSLTVPGVSIVIDSGWEKVNAFDPTTGFDRLDLRRISEASATQRAGRAARERPGIAYRLWTSAEAFRLPDFRPPEITRADPSRAALEVASWSGADPRLFAWFERPNAGALENAMIELQNIDALDEAGTITDVGRELLKHPLPPRLAKLVLEGEKRGLKSEAALCATVLSEPDHWRAPKISEAKCDICFRARQLSTERNSPAFRTAQQIAGGGHLTFGSEPQVRRLLFDVFNDKLAIQRSENRFAVSGGGSVSLRTNVTHQYVLALRVHGTRKIDGVETGTCWFATEVESAWVDDVAEEGVAVEFDPTNETVSVFSIQRVGTLEINRKRTAVGDASPEEIRAAFLRVVLNDVSRAFTVDDKAAQFIARYERLFEHSPLEDVELLQMLIGNARSFKETRRIKLATALPKLIPYDVRTNLDSHYPTAIEVPSGKNRPIDYTVDPPVLAVRIQELFGLTQTPTIGAKKTALCLHLLAPNYRPAQVTEDLASFWKNTYPEVRKELRARYPKHDWPEDPLSARAKSK